MKTPSTSIFSSTCKMMSELRARSGQNFVVKPQETRMEKTRALLIKVIALVSSIVSLP